MFNPETRSIPCSFFMINFLFLASRGHRRSGSGGSYGVVLADLEKARRSPLSQSADNLYNGNILYFYLIFVGNEMSNSFFFKKCQL